MRIRSLLLIFILIPAFVFSQVQWQNNGIPLRIAENINWNGAGSTISGGSVVIVWRDSRDESYQIYAQKIDVSGSLLWGGGINISNTIGQIGEPVIAAASDGGVFVAWRYSSINSREQFISVQKLSSQGDLLWSANGINWSAENTDSSIYLTPDQAGGVFVSWKVYYQIKCKLLLDDGAAAPGWNELGNVIMSFPDPYIHEVAFTLLDDHLLFAYIVSSDNYYEVYVQKINASGNPQWGIFGNLVCSNQDYKRNLNLLNSSNGFWVGWRYSVLPFIDIYRFNFDGSQYWIDPLILNTNSNYLNDLFLISDNLDNLYAGWYEFNNNDNAIRIAKIDTAQNLLWGDQGIIARPLDNGNYDFSMQAAENGNLNFICTNIYPVSSLYFDQFDANGNSTLSQPLEITQLEDIIRRPLIFRHNYDQCFFCWVEYKSGYDDIRYQILDNTNQPVLSAGGEIAFSGISGQVWKMNTIALQEQAAVSWQNQASGEIFLQILDNNGNMLAGNGIAIAESNYPNSTKHNLVYDELNNTVILGWEQGSGIAAQVCLQAVDMDGNLLWGEDGVVPTNSDWEKFCIHTSAQNGYIYPAWSEYNGDWLNPVIEVFANKIDADGNLLWSESGVQISDLAFDDTVDDICGTFFVWKNEAWPNYTLHAKLLDENGNTAAGWEEEGLLISDMTGINIGAEINEVDTGYLITWQNRSYNGNRTIYGQIVSEDGEFLWGENGIQLAVFENYSSNTVRMKVIIDDFIYLIWNDYQNNEYKVCMQKIDLNGNLLWTGNGVVLPAGYNSDFIRINDYTLVVFASVDFSNIQARLFNDAGDELWSTYLCLEVFQQSDPIVARLGENNIMISWRDNRAGVFDPSYGDPIYTGIYAQNIYIEPTYTPDEILNAITAKLHQNYPNPFNPSTTISFSLTTENTENTEITIYNLKGQKIKTLDCSNSFAADARDSRSWKNARDSRSTYSVTWDGTDDHNKPVSSGIYFYKLKAGDFEETRKCLLMK